MAKQQSAVDDDRPLSSYKYTDTTDLAAARRRRRRVLLKAPPQDYHAHRSLITFVTFVLLLLLLLSCCLMSVVDGFLVTTTPLPFSKITKISSSHSSGASCSRRTRRCSSMKMMMRKNEVEQRQQQTTDDGVVAADVTAIAVVAVPYYEQFFTSRLEEWYSYSVNTIKCPFFRRRAADMIDSIAMIGRFLVIRHKSIMPSSVFESFEIVPPGCRVPPSGYQAAYGISETKNRHLNVQQIYNTILQDWSIHNDKGYYITGKLNTTIYTNDCLFDGPDPDMPVRGLRKYLSAASHLFETKHSYAKLTSLSIIEQDNNNNNNSNNNKQIIVAKWKLNGKLMLPWRPSIPTWTGTTTYYLNEENLIYEHQESWDISVIEAFVKTILPPPEEEVGEVEN